MPVTYGSKVGEAFGKDTWLREDEWEIGLAHFPHFYGSSTDNQNIFRVCLHLHLCDSVTDMLTKISDTSGFTARRWATADELFSLPKADQELIGDVVTHKAFDDYVWNEISNASNASLRTALQSIAQLHKPLWLFENRIKESVDQHQEDVDTSSLWAMAYLNVKLSLESAEKLRRTTKWLTELRRKIELFNKCVVQCDDENSMRMEMSEVFSPLLGILHDTIIYLQRYYGSDEFVRNWPSRMEPKLKEHLGSIDDTIKHLQSMSATSRANQAQNFTLGLRDREIEQDGAEQAVFPVESLPAHFRVENFTGRDKEIENIHDRLRSNEKARQQTYLIYGRRGIGKTQIALEYCRRYKKDYDAIFWIQCETSSSLRLSFADIAVALELDGADKNGHFEENLMKVLGWLKRTKKKWLLIYDNAERERLLRGYWPVGGRGSILLTSRSFYNFFEDERRHGETVPYFNEDERWELLMRLLGPEWEGQHLDDHESHHEAMWVDVEKAAAKTLLDRTRGLPLAISHAASLVKNKTVGRHDGDTSIRGFLEIFIESHRQLPTRQTDPRELGIHTLDIIWSIAFKALSENAKAILGVLALLSPDVTLIDLFLPNDQSRLTERLEFCRTGSGELTTRPSIQGMIQPSLALQKAIEELLASAFIFRSGREMRVHREVQEAVWHQGNEQLTDSVDAAINLVYDAFPKQEGGRSLTDQWDSCRRWVQEAIHLANKYWLFKHKDDAPLQGLRSAELLAELLSNCAWYLYEIADYDECLNIVEIGCLACDDKESLTYAHLLNTQGSAWYELNKLKLCRDAFEAAIAIREKLLSEDDPEVTISFANLGNVEAAEGNLDEALMWFGKAANIRERVGDKAATLLGLNYLQIGRAYFQKGRSDYSRAYDFYQRAEGIFNKRTGRNRNYVADLHYAYGNLEFAQKDFSAAARSYELCRRHNMDVNPLHPQMSAACYKLACAAFEQDQHKKALNLLRKALEIADIRSNSTIDGTCARILWKRAEILLDEPLGDQREYALRLMTDLEFKHKEIAEMLGIDERLEDLEENEDKERYFDLLVPGYFR